jgi:hypothetical protein
MKSISASNIVLKILGLLLVAAAVLKGHELLTVPVANQDLWSWRPFLIFQIEFELALGIWLLSGLFKPLAWLAALACFALFCGVTLYKALTGAASCGCFGTVHVNPWITLFAVDLPAVIALSLFRPRLAVAALLSFSRRLPSAVADGRDSIRRAIAEFARPMPSLRRFTATAALGLAILSITTPILALNKPAAVTTSYQVLEPETWIGKELPILEYIDIGGTLEKGIWLLLFYHYDCPDCRRVIPRYEHMAHSLSGGQNPVGIALIAVPPYGPTPVSPHSACAGGQLAGVKEWFITTPATVLTYNATILAAWEIETPDFSSIKSHIARIIRKTGESSDFRIHIATHLNAIKKGG